MGFTLLQSCDYWTALQTKATKNTEKLLYIPDYPYRILIIGGSGSGKTNALLELIKEQDNIDKMYFYAKDLSESKDGFLIKKREDDGTKYCNDLNAFIECLNRMDGVYENIDDYNPNKQTNKNFNCI